MVLRKKGNEFALILSPTNRDIYLADKSLNLEKNNPFVYFKNVCTSARSCELDFRKNGVDQPLKPFDRAEGVKRCTRANTRAEAGETD